jgi:hypothetical protein
MSARLYYSVLMVVTHNGTGLVNKKEVVTHVYEIMSFLLIH